MKLTTTEGITLTVTVRWHNHEPDGIIFFRFQNSMLCSSYYLNTFHAIPDGDGLWLDGGVYDPKTITGAQVKSCKRFIHTCQSLRSTQNT